ncbi:glycosyltransferase family 2 protein [Flavobacterium maritimum]|uniref:glycosyltransferase family 2 protein n=1 Tax=Flavobacterium maritimum TaxID=3149042 RepID=UPI0032B3E586
MDIKVSVILPIYNGEKTLARTLESLVSQSFHDFELVACIDGSKDSSLQILNDFKDKFKKVSVLINDENLGLGSTMNRLVSHANGDYIAVAEQDDFYYENRLTLQVGVLDSKSNVGLVSGIADFWDGDKITFQFPGILVNGEQYPRGKEMFLLNYLHQTKVVNSCMMFRKKVHIDNGLYFSKHYPNVPIDWAYFLRFCMVSDIYGINQSLVLLDRRNDRNSVTSNKQKQFAAARELLRSFYYEYPHLISKKDYKYALTTQHLMELSSFALYQFLPSFILFFIQNPSDKRWLKYVAKRINRFLQK